MDVSCRRYWGTDVAGVAGSLSLVSLHQQARGRAAKRGCVDSSDAIEERLPPVTHSVRTTAPVTVHHKLPAWISQPRLVTADITSGSAPLSSVSLPHVIYCNLKARGYMTLFPVQVKTLPELLTRSSLPPRDVCVCAPTGCGKTLCYVIPIVMALLDCVVRQVHCVVVVPSRLLARQVLAVFNEVTDHTRVRCGLLCGEATLEKEALLLSDHISFPATSQVDVVITTPGRLTDHLQRGSFITLQSLRYLVIDEADKLLNQQIYCWLPQLLQQTVSSTAERQSAWTRGSRNSPSAHLPHSPPSIPLPPSTVPLTARQLLGARQHVQKLLVSATITQDPEALAVLQLYRPLLFSVDVPCCGRKSVSLATPPSLYEAMVICKASLKPLVVLHLVSHLLPQLLPPPTKQHHILCFTNSCETAHRLKVVLDHFSWFSVAVVTSDIAVHDRQRVLHQFTSGVVQILICSDILARGMDIPQCNCVVNYDPPSNFCTYLHRAGRTARAGCKGLALSLIAKEQVSMFHRMLRIADRPRMKELHVTSEDLQPLQAQFEQALLVLKNNCVK